MGYDYSKQNGFSKEEIVRIQVERILEKLSKDMARGGFIQHIFIGQNIKEEWIPDPRSEFCESVDGLNLFLFPFFDEEMVKAHTDFKEKIQKIRKKYSDTDNFIKSDSNHFFSIERLEVTKNLFRDLSKLLHRLNYLKERSYISGLDDDE